MYKKRFIAVITAVAVVLTSSLFALTSCGQKSDEPKLGNASDSQEVEVPETQPMEINFNLASPTQEQKLILDAIEEDILSQRSEYNVDDTISSMSLYSLTLKDGKWERKELLKDKDIEHDTTIPMYFGLYRDSNKMLFSLGINKKDKDVPGQGFSIGSAVPKDSDNMEYYFATGGKTIKKGELCPIAMKLYGSQASLDKVSAKVDETLDKDSSEFVNSVDCFLKDPKILTENNITNYQFIAVEFN